MNDNLYNKKEDVLYLSESWQDDLFLDPYANELDECQFRIDLFETTEEYIVEALLDGINHQDIQVNVNGRKLIINVFCTSSCGKNVLKSRSVHFPFPLQENQINPKLTGDILEITVAKKEKG
ncbi:Hsp20/alpha crystallin family protein [Peribacillus acanthi]|uniref:Hsp20/alpha crystallin family protein n=1 Tax=Peribacillus acanthi TaxID=2171554 RepID=UPI000D3E3E2F|nr:Hsp20/alpha crystallin family protein [Peribacillus acanthi]